MGIQNLPQTSPEERHEVYEDVRQCVSPGFIAHTVNLDGVLVSFRSPMPADLFLLKHRVPPKSAIYLETKLWVLASTTWMVDGQVVLGSPEATQSLYRLYAKMSPYVVGDLYSIFQGLFNRYLRAVQSIEAYCYENTSRFLWSFCNNQMPNSPNVTGIPHSDTLGLNSVQQVWINYNRHEDTRIQDLRDWNVGKLVASATNSKGIKKISDSDAAEAQRETSRREEVMTRNYYVALGIIKDDPDTLPSHYKSAKTKQDLEDEMRRWVAGELDEHDAVVAAYKDRIKQAMQEQERAAQEAAKRMEEYLAAREASIEQGLIPPSAPLVGYTQEQLAEVMKERGIDASAPKRVYFLSEGKYIYDKILSPPEVAGKLAVIDGELVDTSQSTEGNGNLERELSERKPLITTEG